MNTIITINHSVAAMDLEPLYEKAQWNAFFFQYFTLAPGVEHYKLLAYLSYMFPKGSTLIDIGTLHGYSALALSHNHNINVITYNLVDDIPSDVISIKSKSNITWKIKNCLEDIELLLKAPFIMLDTFHDGGFEREFILVLLKNNYKGMVLCDDIYLNTEMKSFWEWVPLEKIDVSKYGHWSGTGIILFDPTLKVVV